MLHRVLNRLTASLLLAVFLATGAVRALDAVVYHTHGGDAGSGVARILSTDTPKTHYDRCVLGAELRGYSAVASCPSAPGIHAGAVVRAAAAPVQPPRSTPLLTAQARAPPALPA